MTFWSGKKLERLMPALVSDYSTDRVDCAAYTLRMGSQYYLSASEADVDTNRVHNLAEGESIAIPSGQFAVLLTQETVTIPPEAIAFISMKTGFKARGLVNVSGFHVDPGYSAPLRFAVFNAGPSTICIRQGEDCFLIWYADLDTEDSAKKYIKGASQNRRYAMGITSADVSSLTGTVRTISILSRRIDDLERTQIWMRLFIGFLSTVAATAIAITIFFAEQGIRSYYSGSSSAQRVSCRNMPEPHVQPLTAVCDP